MAKNQGKTGKHPATIKPVISEDTTQQWKQLKKLNPQQLFLLGHAGSYISMGKDAQAIAQALGKPLEKESRVSYIQFGRAAARKAYRDKLIQAGYSVTFCDIGGQEAKMETHYSADTKVTVQGLLDEARIGTIVKTLHGSVTKNKKLKKKVKL